MLFRSKGGNSIVIIITMEAEFGLEEVVIDSYPSVKGPKSIKLIEEKSCELGEAAIDGTKINEFIDGGRKTGLYPNWALCGQRLGINILRLWRLCHDETELGVSPLDQTELSKFKNIKIPGFILAFSSKTKKYRMINLSTMASKETIFEEIHRPGYGLAFPTSQDGKPDISLVKYFDLNYFWHYTGEGLTRTSYDGSSSRLVHAGKFDNRNVSYQIIIGAQIPDDGLEYATTSVEAVESVCGKGLVFMTKRHDTINNNYVFRVVKIGKHDKDIKVQMFNPAIVLPKYVPVDLLILLERNHVLGSKNWGVGTYLMLLNKKTFEPICTIIVKDTSYCKIRLPFRLGVSGNDLIYLSILRKGTGFVHRMLAVKRDKFHELRIPCSSTFFNNHINAANVLDSGSSFAAFLGTSSKVNRYDYNLQMSQPQYLYFKFQ